ncbi:MAG TPA: hypothetical protein VN788_15370 [Verrucomicrobiae bacterium]|nr:hypothetical protein [Verrucomicrobiae bacterium]
MIGPRIHLAIQRTGRLEALLIEASPQSMERYAVEAAGLVSLLNEIQESVTQGEPPPMNREYSTVRADLEVLSWRLSRARTLLGGVSAALEHWAGIALDDDSATASYNAAGSAFGPARSGMVITHG